MADVSQKAKQLPSPVTPPTRQHSWTRQGFQTIRAENVMLTECRPLIGQGVITLGATPSRKPNLHLYGSRRLILCCVSPEQRLYVSADPGGLQCHPVCNRPVALPHLRLEVHPQSSALLPWLDLRISRENDHINKSLAGECVILSFN